MPAAVLVDLLRLLDGSSLGLCLALASALPLAVLVHELGHAAVGLAATDGLVHFSVSRRPAWIDLRISRLAIAFSPLPAERGPAGVAQAFAAAVAALRPPAYEETRRRWAALVRNPQSPVRTGERGLKLGEFNHVLEAEPGSDEFAGLGAAVHDAE